jgi:hypothetical protein
MLTLAADHRHALKMLAGSRNGHTESVMIVRGFGRVLLAELILAGFICAETERMMVEGKAVNDRRLRITKAGRQALRSCAFTPTVERQAPSAALDR